MSADTTDMLDIVAERAGGYVEFSSDPSKEFGIDMSRMRSYCKTRGIDPLDLTVRERNRFVMRPEESDTLLATLPDAGMGYDIREISRYSKEKGVEPVDLTMREI